MGASTRMYKQFKADLDSLAINPSRTWGSMPCIRRGCIEGLECLLRCRDAGKESFYRECGKGYIAKESGQQREGGGGAHRPWVLHTRFLRMLRDVGRGSSLLRKLTICIFL